MNQPYANQRNSLLVNLNNIDSDDEEHKGVKYIKTAKHYDNLEFSNTDFEGMLEERQRQSAALNESSRFLNDALEKAYQ